MLFRSFLTTAIVFLLAISFTACGQNATNNEAAPTDEPEQTAEEQQLSEEELANQRLDSINGVRPQPIRSSYDFKMSMTGVLQQYFAVRDALANDNLAQAKEFVLPFVEAMSNVRPEEVNETAKPIWEDHKSNLVVQINMISKAEDLATARQVFSDLSSTMTEIQQQLGSTAPELYSIYCSTALNGQGAAWLSAKQTVKNPYSSSEPNCGEVGENIATKIN